MSTRQGPGELPATRPVLPDREIAFAAVPSWSRRRHSLPALPVHCINVVPPRISRPKIMERARAHVLNFNPTPRRMTRPLSLPSIPPTATPCAQCGAPLNPAETAHICPHGCGTLHMQCVDAHSTKHKPPKSPEAEPVDAPTLPGIGTLCPQCGAPVHPEETAHVCPYGCGTVHLQCLYAHSRKHKPINSSEPERVNLPPLPAIGTHCAHCYAPIKPEETVQVCTYCCGTLHVVCVDSHNARHNQPHSHPWV
jgi:hypothetical protein